MACSSLGLGVALAEIMDALEVAVVALEADEIERAHSLARSGCKRIVAPDGSAIGPATKPQPDGGTLVKALARAWRWQRMLDEGVYACMSEIGNAENISKSYVSRILRLALLAPDLVDAILAGSTDQGMMPKQLERPMPTDWDEQRCLLRVRAG